MKTSEPEKCVVTVLSPRGLVGIDDGGRLDFVSEVFIQGLGLLGGEPIEGQSGGGDEAQAKEIAEDRSDFSVGEAHIVVQVGGRGFGHRADMGVGELAGSELTDSTMASRTKGLLVAEVGDEGLRSEDDVFLEVLGNVVHGGESVGGTMGTARRSRDVHDLVDMIGGRTKPAGMSHGCAPLLGGRVVVIPVGQVCDAVVLFLGVSFLLELLPVQRNELGTESVVFGFEFLDALFGLPEELIQVVDLVPELFVLFGEMVILRSDPLCG
jgi:hypothetical protein